MSNALALYQIADEYLQAAEKLANLDLDEQTIADTLDGLAGAVEVKATNIAFFIRNLEATSDAISQAEEKMVKRRHALIGRADRIRKYLLTNMERTQLTVIECPEFKIAIRKNPPSVVIDSLNAVPDAFMYQPETPPPPPAVPDKAKIAKAIKNGLEVPGCHLQSTKRVDIR